MSGGVVWYQARQQFHSLFSGHSLQTACSAMEFFMVTLIIFILIIIGLLLYLIIPYHFYSPSASKLINKIPGEKALPIFGNSLSFLVPNHEILSKLGYFYQQNDDVYRMWFIGIPYVFFKKLHHIEMIMSSKSFTSKSFDYGLLFPWLGNGLVTASGHKWFKHRKILTPAFHFKILEEFMPIFISNSKIFINKLKDNTDKIIDLKQFITLCTLDIICETSMGTSVYAQTSTDVPYVQATLRMSEIFQKRQFSFWLHRPLAFAMSALGREQKEVLKILHGFTGKVIKERRSEYRMNRHLHSENLNQNKKRRLTFLDLMIEISENDPEALTDEEIREQVDTFMFEGHDTTAAALTWACYLLGRHPEIQEAAYEELEYIFQGSDRDPTIDDLAEMKLLDRIIKETLRLYPSVPLLGRATEEQVNIDGYILPPKTQLPIFPYWLHRDPNLYENPLKFDPDRFLPENIANRHPFAYLPFSAGPRNCIGQRFAMMEEKVLLSSVIRNFKIESLDKEEDIKMMAEIVLRPKDYLGTILRPRNIH